MYHQAPIGVKNWNMAVKDSVNGVHTLNLMELTGINMRIKVHSFSPLDAITHGRDISNAWTTFMLDKSNGFTHAGLVRINESIRMFVWALLGAQSRTSVEILKVGTGFDAQKQFLAIIQDAINNPIDLPSQILRYEKCIKICKKVKLITVMVLGFICPPVI